MYIKNIIFRVELNLDGINEQDAKKLIRNLLEIKRKIQCSISFEFSIFVRI